MKTEKIMLERTEQENIQYLLKEIEALKEEIKNIKHKKVLTTEESLVSLWDNPYDERWNSC